MGGEIFPLHFLRHFSPKPFAVFSKGVSQVGKNPVRGFIAFCSHEHGTQFAYFRFRSHEASGKVSYLGCRILPDGLIQCML